MLRWGLGLELFGFFIIGFIVSIFLLNKIHLGSRYVEKLDKTKGLINRILNKIKLHWFTEADRLTVSLLIFGTILYFIGMILQAIYQW